MRIVYLSNLIGGIKMATTTPITNIANSTFSIVSSSLDGLFGVVSLSTKSASILTSDNGLMKSLF
jgi:hypothetical protein